MESALYRIIEESVTNARRHSGTDRIRIRLMYRDGRVLVEIEDQGGGFDPQAVSQSHFGLEGIRQRARLFGGSAVVDAAPGRGTSIRVDLPCLPDAPESQ